MLLSILAGAALSVAAMAVANARQGARATVLAAILLMLGIIAHHFTAMSAVTFVADPAVVVTGSELPAAILGLTIAGVTMMVLGIAFALAVVDRLLAERNALLDSALENVTQGVTVFDASGRLLLINDQYRDMYRLSADTAIPGIWMRDLPRTAARRRDIQWRSGPARQIHRRRMEAARKPSWPMGGSS